MGPDAMILVFWMLSFKPAFSLTSFIFIKRLFSFSSLSTIRSDQISRSVMSDSLRPHESQHARPPCPSPTPRVHSDSRPLSQWCHPAISSSVVPSPVQCYEPPSIVLQGTHIYVLLSSPHIYYYYSQQNLFILQRRILWDIYYSF